jgi:hypothetical protein
MKRILILVLLILLVGCNKKPVEEPILVHPSYRIEETVKDLFSTYDSDEHFFWDGRSLEGWSDWKTIKINTCLDDGLEERTRTCAVCGLEEKEERVLHALGHNNTYKVVKQPTCTRDGWGVYTCRRCGITEEKTLPKLGHTVNWQVVVEPTCTTNGREESVCERCGHVDSKVIQKLGHIGEWVITKEPDCTHKGTKTRVCETCGVTETVDIMYLGHTGEWAIIQQGSCTVDEIKQRTCERCGITETVTTPAVGHNLSYNKNVTSDQHISYRTVCNNCGHVSEADTVMDALQGHFDHCLESPECNNYTNWALRYPKCTRCGTVVYENAQWHKVIIGE